MQVQYQAFPYPDGGLNEGMPAHMIGDNQFAAMENWHYTRGGKLTSRPGTEFIHSTYEHLWSIYCWRQTTGASQIVWQEGTTIYGGYSEGPFTTIRSGATVGSRSYVSFEGVLYAGTPGSSSSDNLKWTGTGAGTTIGGSPPALGSLCIWNYRLWGVHRSNRDLLYFSALGDAEDWTTSGVSGAGFVQIGEDGQPITALVAHNEQLFIFKPNSIYHIVTGNPNTDTSLWRIEIISPNIGCDTQNAITTIGNDIIFPTGRGIFTLNTALYSGDFASVNLSTPINYNSESSFGAYCQALDHYLYFDYADSSRSIYAMEKRGQNIRWSKIKIRSNLFTTEKSDTPLQPWLIAGDFYPQTTWGNYPGQYGVLLAVTNLNFFNGNSYRQDLISYPTTRQGSQSHYDYIGGPDGARPIKLSSRSKMFNFGSFGHFKRSRNLVFASLKNDREEEVVGDETTLSVIYDGDETNKKTSRIVSDVGTDVASTITDNVGTLNRSPLRVAKIGLGGTNGQNYRTIQVEIEHDVGGYQLEYAGLEMDVEQLGNFPVASGKVLS